MGLFTGLRLRFTVALLLPLALLLGAFLAYLAMSGGCCSAMVWRRASMVWAASPRRRRPGRPGGGRCAALAGACGADRRRSGGGVCAGPRRPGGILARGVPHGFDDARIRRALTGDAISTFPLFSDARRLGELVVLADRSAIEARVERYRGKLWLGAALLLLGLSGGKRPMIGPIAPQISPCQ
ncbi:MAG: hypothetical protein G8D58_07255 [gamma proteobacterium symbiont of Phacoides pectinatus]